MALSCIISYEDESDAVRIANDTPYGLLGYVTSRDLERARRDAKRIRSGNVHINGARGSTLLVALGDTNSRATAANGASPDSRNSLS